MSRKAPVGRRRFLQLGTAATVCVAAGCLEASEDTANEDADDGETALEDTQETAAVIVEDVTRELTQPWGMVPIPEDSRLLVTEKAGTLVVLDPEDGTVMPVSATPRVYAAGQGGLLDVAIHPAFPDQSWVYLTYAARNSAGETATHLGRGKVDLSEPAFVQFEQLHVAEPFVDSTGHYGSRVVFGEDGMLYMTTGDRQFKNFGPEHVSQDKTNELGATLRLEPDGSIPEDNPFVGTDGTDAIFSYGHRNPQGMTIHPDTGEIWQSEHGELDGDELNIVERGGNYGWPIADEACEYGTEERVAESHTERDDVVDPVYFWECGSGGFPPGGMTFYDSDVIPQWEGDLFVGNLFGQYLGRFTVDGRTVEEAEPLLADRNWRIRDVTVAPETGYLYVAVDASDGPIVRIRPEDGD